jgi:Flp pilus assembly pilin Flp
MWWIERGWVLVGRLQRGRPRLNARPAGQSTVEYALVGALVVIAAAGALSILGGELNTVFSQITTALRGAAGAH